MWHFILVPREIRVQCYCLCLLAKFFISATFLHFWNWCFLSAADIYDEVCTKHYSFKLFHTLMLWKKFSRYPRLFFHIHITRIWQKYYVISQATLIIFFCGKLSLNSTYVHSLIGWLLCEWVGKFLASHSQKNKGSWSQSH